MQPIWMHVAYKNRRAILLNVATFKKPITCDIARPNERSNRKALHPRALAPFNINFYNRDMNTPSEVKRKLTLSSLTVSPSGSGTNSQARKQSNIHETVEIVDALVGAFFSRQTERTRNVTRPRNALLKNHPPFIYHWRGWMLRVTRQQRIIIISYTTVDSPPPHTTAGYDYLEFCSFRFCD